VGTIDLQSLSITAHAHIPGSKTPKESDVNPALRAVIERDYPEHLPEFELALNAGLRKGSMYSLTRAMVD